MRYVEEPELMENWPPVNVFGPRRPVRPGWAFCPLPPPVPNATFVHEGPCGARFWTDEKGDYWYSIWCDDHGRECCDAVQRIVTVGEYQRLTALDIRTL